MRAALERLQIWIYAGSMVAGIAGAFATSAALYLEYALTPALALMLFATFMQMPITGMGRLFREKRFVCALLASNFVAIPALVFLICALVKNDSLLRLGILMVLLTPCIDYVITFAQPGKADARLLLAATPILMLSQMLLLPVYLSVFADGRMTQLFSPEPLLQAFLGLIAVPFALASAVQILARRTGAGKRMEKYFACLSVPATALVLFLVAVSVVPVMTAATDYAMSALPAYVVFACTAPVVGWGTARLFGLRQQSLRAITFSSATRNALVVLPLAYTIPAAVPVLPAIIVTQTLVELMAQHIYIHAIPRLPA